MVKKDILYIIQSFFIIDMVYYKNMKILGRTGKQFFIYYVFFALCMVILFIPLYQINLSMVSRAYQDASGGLLETGLTNLEMDINQIEAIAITINNSPYFRRISYLADNMGPLDYYYTISLVDNFRRYFAASGLIADCGIIYHNGIILTSKRLYFPWEQFYGNYFSQTGISGIEQWLIKMPQESTMSGFIPYSSFSTREGSYEGITFCINLSGAQGRKSFFFATLEKTQILSRLATDVILREGRLQIYDPIGNIILDTGNVKVDDPVILEMMGQRRGIRVKVEIPRKVFWGQMTPFFKLAIIFVLGYLVLGIILSLFFAHRSARPIREIVEHVLYYSNRRIPEENSEENLANTENDYTYIQHFLSKVDKNLEDFNIRLAQQEKFQKDNIFERLLYGLIYSVDSWQVVKDIFPDIPPVFRIAALALPSMEDAMLSVHTMRQAMIQDIIEPYLPRASHTHFSGNTLILLLPEEDEENLIHHLHSITADLQGKLNISCRTALSDPVRDIHDIHRAFFLTRHLLRFPPKKDGEDILRRSASVLAESSIRDLGGGSRNLPPGESPQEPVQKIVVPPGKENSGQISLSIEFLDASRLYEFLYHGEEDKAVDFVNNMFYELCRQGYTSEDDIQQIFFIYRRVIIQIASDFELDLSREEIIPVYDSKQEFSFLFAHMAEALRKICALINTRNKEKNNNFEWSILNYIDENITNPNLYTKLVTASFRISENRLQTIVRKWTGKSFLEYVESKRMIQAREMLLKTTKTVSQICGECGYSLENSFYKAFRRFYGQSPSEIR